MLNDIQISLCEKEKKYIIANLIQFYFYDLLQFSQYTHYKFMENGLIEKIPYFDNYWEEKNRYPYLIRQAQIPIGFALIHDITLNKDADWKMAEFFILAPYRKKGIGQSVVKSIFKEMPGLWEISVLKDNESAKNFWCHLLSPDTVPRHYEKFPQFLVYEIKVK